MRKLLKDSSTPADEIACIGLSGQMHGAVLLDRNNEVLRPALIWCDQRTAAECRYLNDTIGPRRLVELGVNQMIKDQILGHFHSGDPSWNYTNVSMPTLLEAINRLPVIDAWAAAPWMNDPLAYATRLAEGTGARTDLIRLKVRREKRAKVNVRKKVAERVRKHRAKAA